MTTRLETQGLGMRTAGWCAALLAGFCWLAAMPVLADEPPTLVEVSEVRRDKVRDELVTFGALRSDESVMIRPELAGRLARLHFREGQQVAAGDLLVSLDDAIASAELAQAKANLSLAERSAQRTRQLYQRGASNAQALVEAQALDEVCEPDAEHECRQERADARRPVEGATPLRLGTLGPVLEGDAAQDQTDQHEEQRQVQRGEQRRVPAWERGEGGAAGGEQPHLVAVPHRADRVDDHPASLLVVFHGLAAEEGDQHGDAVVEALQEEVADPQHRDEEEPHHGEGVHRERSLQRGQHVTVFFRVVDTAMSSAAMSGG